MRLTLALTVVLAAVAAAVAYGPAPAPASHDEGAAYTDPNPDAPDAKRGPLCYMQPNTRDTTKHGVGALPGRRSCAPEGDLLPGVARNLVGDVPATPADVAAAASKPIDVCAEENYGDSTQEAIRLLNDAGFGRALFAWKGLISDTGDPPSKCGHELASGRVSSIIVTDNYANDDSRHPTKCGGRSFACALHYTIRAAPHYGYVGQAEVRINPHLDVVTAAETGRGRTMYGTCAPGEHEDRPDYNPATAKLRICNVPSAVVPGRADGTLQLTYHIAHELMHLVGLKDYYCGKKESSNEPADDPLVTSQTLMDSLFREDCRSPLMEDDDARKAGTGELATDWDRADYAALYSPAAVTGLQATDAPNGKLRLSWTADHVHVEKGFAVELEARPNVWERVTGALATANAGNITIDRPASATSYRVVSVTDAGPPGASSDPASYTPPATGTKVMRTRDASSTAGQPKANEDAKKAARAALEAAYPGVTVTEVELDEELPETTIVTASGSKTRSGTGAREEDAEANAISNAEAAARDAGGDEAKIKSRVTDTTPPTTRTESDTATGSGSGATEADAKSNALDDANGKVPSGAETGSPSYDTTPPDTRTDRGTASGIGTGSTGKEATSWALSNANGKVPRGAIVTRSTVSTPTPRYRTGTTTVAAGYTGDTDAEARSGCSAALASAAGSVSGYVSHWSRIVTGPWSATAEAKWSRTLTTYHARATATGTVPP